ncbi:MAG: ABC transporter substrate-binding protein [Thermoanaerobaculia bacterium]
MRASTRSATSSRGWTLHLGTVAFALVLLAPPLVAEPQQPAKVFRIVVLTSHPAPQGGTANETLRGFRQTLRELGYIQGENILIEERFEAGREDRLREYAAEAVRLQVDVIFAVSYAAIQAAANATQTIPIVGHDLDSDPVASGFVASLARPGGNVTGVFLNLPELSGKALQLLKEAIPGIARVAVLRSPTTAPAPLRAAEVATRSLGLQLQIVEAGGPGDFESAFSAAVAGRNRALMVIPSPMFGAHRTLISDLAVKHRLATTSILPLYAEAGLLMSYGPDVHGMARQAAPYVDRILKGAKAGDLPVLRPARFEMIINLKTARAIGLTIPPSLILRADRVVE